MKRAAAIIGSTPPFIRWAIRADCPLMRPSGPAAQNRNPAQTAWRQLRGVKEVSRAIAQGRSYGGYCFAPLSKAEQVVAVPIEEVTAPLGGGQRVSEACRACPANPTPNLNRWAACTGLLPLVVPEESLPLTRAAWVKRRQEIERRAAATEGGEAHDCSWTRVWSGPALSPAQVVSARRLLLAASDLKVEHAWEYEELIAALDHAEQRGMSLWMEPVPAGWSDGQSWSLPDHCRFCGAEWLGCSLGGPCSSCGNTGGHQATRKLKVLGLRPYLQLSQVLGETAARQLQREYELQREGPAMGGQPPTETGLGC
jgi:hypothetical protein